MPDLQAVLAHALAEPLPREFAPVTYQITLLAVAVGMVLLVGVYLALLAGLAWAVWWWLAHMHVMFDAGIRGRAIIAVVVAYVGPALAGGVAAVFMAKPLLARRAKPAEQMTLARADAPLLFELVERLARVTGAPMPRRIDVDTQINASAGFRRGAWSLLGRGDVVLTIGLPLAAGLGVGPFAGVLAHELGHFAQRAGMRLTYLVRGINLWFARVVHERDAWDEWLDGATADLPYLLVPVVWVARGAVWLGRRVLWVLMHVGQFISCRMLREMEFDADRYEAAIAGTDAAAATTDELLVLNVAAAGAMGDVRRAYDDRRLPDDYVALVASNVGQIPPATLAEIRRRHAARPTRWFDTHPSDAARVAALRRDPTPGRLRDDRPAAALFADFDGLCLRATMAMYRRDLGGHMRGVEFVAARQLVTAAEQRQAGGDALRRFTQGAITDERGLPLAQTPATPEAAAERLLVLRSRIQKHAPAARQALVRRAEAVRQLEAVAIARAARQAGVRKLDPKMLDLPAVDEASLGRLRDEARARRDEADKVLEKWDDWLAERLVAALALDEPSEPADATRPDAGEAEDVGAYDLAGAPEPSAEGAAGLARSAAEVGRLLPIVAEIRRELAIVATLLRLAPKTVDEAYGGRIVASAKRARSAAERLREAAGPLAYPYDHADGPRRLGAWLVPELPPVEDFYGACGACGAADAAAGRAGELWARLMTDLAANAEAAEARAGLPPLPDPPAAEKGASSPAQSG